MTKFGPFNLDNWSIKKIFMVSIVVHVITAFFSQGFFQFDEHYMILEFIGHKLNGTPAADLPWEYESQIRPWFQVLLYYIILAPLKAIGLSSPFAQAALLRIMTSLICVFSVYSLKSYFEDDVKKQKIYFFFLLFSWFIPVIHARASSETLSAAFIFLGFSALIKSLKSEDFYKGALAGLYLGLAYLVKSQLSIAVAMLWFWLVIFHPKKWRTSLSSSFVILLMIGLGVIIDFWGYGEWVFSIWNYFKINILENRVSDFGVDPWWYYFKLTFMKGIPIVSLPFIVGALYFWIRKWRHPITWMTAPLFLIHCLIGHKELRFIFLIVVFAPLMLALLLEEHRKLDHKLVKIFIYLNLIIMVPVGLKSANSSIRFFQHIHDNKITYFQAQHEDPFYMVSLKMNFYYPKSLKVVTFKEDPLAPEGYIFFKTGKKYFEYSKKKNCKLDYLSYPSWSLNFNIGNWIERSRVWSLWKCSKQEDVQSLS